MTKISSDRLTYHQITASHTDFLITLYTNKKVRKYLGGQLNHDSANQKASNLISKQPELLWTLEDSQQNLVGMIELDTHHDSDDLEISYQFLPDFWGNGYAFEALNTIVEFAFTELKLSRVVAETQETNLRSIKLLKKSGFTMLKGLKRFGENQLIFRKQN